ncbi:uncharacterized protein LOC144926941 [Branchiostoma floridae x Branchiostoma belcheri]
MALIYHGYTCSPHKFFRQNILKVILLTTLVTTKIVQTHFLELSQSLLGPVQRGGIVRKKLQQGGGDGAEDVPPYRVGRRPNPFATDAESEEARGEETRKKSDRSGLQCSGGIDITTTTSRQDDDGRCGAGNGGGGGAEADKCHYDRSHLNRCWQRASGLCGQGGKDDS